MNELLIAQAAATLGGAYEKHEIINVYITVDGAIQVQMSATQLAKHFSDTKLAYIGEYENGEPIIYRQTELMGVLFFCLVKENDLTDEELKSIGLERF